MTDANEIATEKRAREEGEADEGTPTKVGRVKPTLCGYMRNMFIDRGFYSLDFQKEDVVTKFAHGIADDMPSWREAAIVIYNSKYETVVVERAVLRAMRGESSPRVVIFRDAWAHNVLAHIAEVAYELTVKYNIDGMIKEYIDEFNDPEHPTTEEEHESFRDEFSVPLGRYLFSQIKGFMDGVLIDFFKDEIAALSSDSEDYDSEEDDDEDDDDEDEEGCEDEVREEEGPIHKEN